MRTLRGVGHRYGVRGAWVVRGVDLRVGAGALVRVQGGNGSGKSTLLRLVAGIDAPREGTVTGRPRTAYVPERFPAALPFTGLDYLTHMGRIHGLSRGIARRRAGAWLERFGAGGHARTPLAEMSKGTAQKVVVAQALLAEPELLVLDEAWTGLDPEARGVLDGAVAERIAAGGAVVFVDHDPRRPAEAAAVVYRVEGGAVTAVPGASVEGAVAGGMVHVHVRGSRVRGAGLPPGLPGAPVVTYGPDGADGAVRLTVAAADSDALLRALLTAEPPWHVVAVAPVSGPAPAPGLPGPSLASSDLPPSYPAPEAP